MVLIYSFITIDDVACSFYALFRSVKGKPDE